MVKEQQRIPCLFFQHRGHWNEEVLDFQWNEMDEWTVASVSADLETSGGGGMLQIWHMNLVWTIEVCPLQCM